ncbi:MAG: Spy/CpxP family protein refolding chaperone [Rhizomicrobium sp.]
MRISRLFGVSGAFLLLLTAFVHAQSPEMQQLHDALNLRPDQEASWQTYARSLAIDPQEAARRRDFDERMESLNAPGRVDLSIQMMKDGLAVMERRGAALKIFYAALTPSQQAAFDRETMQPPPGPPPP